MSLALAQTALKHELYALEAQLVRLRTLEADFGKLGGTLAGLTDEVKWNDVVIPISPLATMPGSLVHTNDILVRLGGGLNDDKEGDYYVELTAKQASGVAKRKMEAAKRERENVQGRIQTIRQKIDILRSPGPAKAYAPTPTSAKPTPRSSPSTTTAASPKPTATVSAPTPPASSPLAVQIDPNQKILNEDGEPIVEIREDVPSGAGAFSTAPRARPGAVLFDEDRAAWSSEARGKERVQKFKKLLEELRDEDGDDDGDEDEAGEDVRMEDEETKQNGKSPMDISPSPAAPAPEAEAAPTPAPAPAPPKVSRFKASRAAASAPAPAPPAAPAPAAPAPVPSQPKVSRFKAARAAAAQAPGESAASPSSPAPAPAPSPTPPTATPTLPSIPSTATPTDSPPSTSPVDKKSVRFATSTSASDGTEHELLTPGVAAASSSTFPSAPPPSPSIPKPPAARPIKDSVLERPPAPPKPSRAQSKAPAPPVPSVAEAEDEDEDEDDDFDWDAEDDDSDEGMDIDDVLMAREVALAYHAKRDAIGAGRGTGPLGGEEEAADLWDQEWVPQEASLAHRPPPASRFKASLNRPSASSSLGASVGDLLPSDDDDAEAGASIIIPRLLPGVKMGRLAPSGDMLEVEESDEDETDEARRILEALRRGERWEAGPAAEDEARRVRRDEVRRPPVVHRTERRPVGETVMERATPKETAAPPVEDASPPKRVSRFKASLQEQAEEPAPAPVAPAPDTAPPKFSRFKASRQDAPPTVQGVPERMGSVQLREVEAEAGGAQTPEQQPAGKKVSRFKAARSGM